LKNKIASAVALLIFASDGRFPRVPAAVDFFQADVFRRHGFSLQST